MLSTHKIAVAFQAIVEEAEKIKDKDLPAKTQKRLKNIVSIAKHQNDIRKSKKGSCKSKKKTAKK